VLPTLRFFRELGLVFLWSCVFFERLAGCLLLGLFLADFCFADCFFSNFMSLLLFQFIAKGKLGVFCENLLILGLFFSDLPPCFSI